MAFHCHLLSLGWSRIKLVSNAHNSNVTCYRVLSYLLIQINPLNAELNPICCLLAL